MNIPEPEKKNNPAIGESGFYICIQTIIVYSKLLGLAAN